MTMTLTMRAEIRDAWADALESGEYEQTNRVLARPGGGFCCLGVLCDLAVKAGAIPAPLVVESDDDEDECFEYGTGEGENASHTGLPLAVVRWAGFEDNATIVLSDPRLTRLSEDGSPPVARSAATWNDDYDATFPEIAAMVRAIRPTDEPA